MGTQAAGRARRWARGLGACCAVAALLALAWATMPWQPTAGSSASPVAAAHRPTPLAADQRLPAGQPAPLAQAHPSFRYVLTDDIQQPVRYDPCRSLHYVIRPQASPLGSEALIAESFAALSAATGLHVLYDGGTDEGPSRQRAPFQPERYGDRWAPVLIAWVTPDEQPDFAADVLGQAGRTPVTTTDGTQVYVTGQVELDSPQVTALLHESGGRTAVTALLKHELGHLVGLDHVNDPSQLMYAQTAPGVTDYGAGDLTGLARLGNGPCIPNM